MTGPLIGVDVGGTKLSVATLQGGVLDVSRRPDRCGQYQALIDEIVDAVELVRDRGTAAVGVGVPSWSSSRPAG